MANVFLTSDLHIGHRNILLFCSRPWPDVASMNRCLIQNWNEVVSDNDTVFVLGDFAMGQITETLPVAEQLRGRKYLLSGNHDRCHPMHRKADEWVQRYEDAGFTVLPPQVRLPVNGLGEVLLCHFPYSGDSQYDDRYTEWRPVDDGSILLHGHTHSKVATTDGRQFNVGVDAHNYRPVTINEILGV